MAEQNFAYFKQQRSKKRLLALGVLIFILGTVVGIVSIKFFLTGITNGKESDTIYRPNNSLKAGAGLAGKYLNKINDVTSHTTISEGRGDEMSYKPLVPELVTYYSSLSQNRSKNITSILIEAAKKNLKGASGPIKTDSSSASQAESIPKEILTAEAISLLNHYWGVIIKSFPRFSENSIPDSLLFINERSTAEDIKKYFNAVAEVYKRFATSLAGTEERVLEESSKSGNMPVELIGVKDTIQKMRNEILKIEVPRKILTLHKKELWGLENTILQLSLLANASPKEDSLYFLILIRLRADLKASMAAFHAEKVPRWLKENNIKLDPGSSAELFYSTSVIQQNK